jgi:hypothetical protein
MLSIALPMYSFWLKARQQMLTRGVICSDGIVEVLEYHGIDFFAAANATLLS